MAKGKVDRKNSEFYNAELKNEYLSDMIKHEVISLDTSKSYSRMFNVTREFEEELNKDLSEFSFEELEKVLYGFQANNRNTVVSYTRIISSYLRWCKEKGKIEENILSTLASDDLQKYITNYEIYFTDKQLRRYEDACENYQDAVILRLLFVGVGGKQMSEIRNLRKEDVDFENERLTLRSTLTTGEDGLPLKFTERVLNVDTRTMDLIKGAIEQKTYLKRNGELNQTENNNIRPFTDLVENDYIIRTSITKTDNYNIPTDRYVIYRRIATISEFLGIEELTTKFIQRSGMIYFANEIIKDEDDVSLEDLKIIATRFNLKSHHNLKGFVTMENIRKTYPHPQQK